MVISQSPPSCGYCGKRDDHPEYGVLWSIRLDEWCCYDCVQLEPPPKWSGRDCPNPFSRPLDQILTGLRAHAALDDLRHDAYRLISGEDHIPDRWAARCPMHPIAGFTLIVTDRGEEQKPELWCRAGCEPNVIYRLLVPDPEREKAAETAARVVVWAQNYRSQAA